MLGLSWISRGLVIPPIMIDELAHFLFVPLLVIVTRKYCFTRMLFRLSNIRISMAEIVERHLQISNPPSIPSHNIYFP